MAPEETTAFIRCVDCRCEYQPGQHGSIVCPDFGGAAWVSAEITLTAEPKTGPEFEPAGKSL